MFADRLESAALADVREFAEAWRMGMRNRPADRVPALRAGDSRGTRGADWAAEGHGAVGRASGGP